MVAMLTSVQHAGQSMTNSTPKLVAWLAEYRKFLILVADGATDEAALLKQEIEEGLNCVCLLYTSPSPRDRQKSRMPSSA